MGEAWAFLRPYRWVPKHGSPAFGVSAGLEMHPQLDVMGNRGSGILSCTCGQHNVPLFDVGQKGRESSMIKQGDHYVGSLGDEDAISWSKEER